MNRREAIIVMRDTNWSRMMVDWSYADRRRVLDAIMASLAALRVPEPDPDTGLTPCGCGGRAVVWEGRMHSDTYYVQCLFCGVRTVDKVKKADAIREFNTAMGWKGGAE